MTAPRDPAGGDELTVVLKAVLDDLSGEHTGADVQRAAGRLMAAYRAGTELPDDLLATPSAAFAYAAYRMPATYVAVREALRAAVAVDPPLAPRTCLDVGGGTGAGLWAAARTFPALTSATVLDRSHQALRLGRLLAERGASPALRTAVWTRAYLTSAPLLPRADLVMMTYVLAELPAPTRAALVAAAGDRADTLVVVEPGTPAGYRRTMEARDLLIAQGFHIIAPCPHDRTCPLVAGQDWCHFSARLRRAARHRRLKGGSLGHEDEKFSYVVASRAVDPPRPDRIIRHPQISKGMVDLRVCTLEQGIRHLRVTKRQGRTYRTARHARWGSAWTMLDR